VGIGIVLRLRLYHLNRSLWLDELFLVNNFTSRSYLELVGPLEYNQSAGLFFLWLTKSVNHLIGQGPNQVGARNRGAVATTDGSHNAISIDGLNAARGRFFPHAPVSHPIFWMTAICLAWFLSFAGHYLVQLRHLQGYDSLFEYWLKYGGFPKGDPFVSLEWWFWPFHAFFKLMLRLAGIHGIYNEVLLGTWMALASFVMGVFILMRRKRHGFL